MKKKLFTLLFTLAVATAMAMPASAKWIHKKKKDNAETTETTKAHKKHSKKKGATEGSKEGQQDSNPGKSN